MRYGRISARFSMLQYRSVCCSGYSGSYPDCQRKNNHVTTNIYNGYDVLL